MLKLNTLSGFGSGVAGGATVDPIYGYWSGGEPSGMTDVTDRIIYSTSVTSANTDSDLSTAKNGATGISDTTTYGYIVGGSSGAVVDTTDRIVFSTSVTSANTDSDLPTATTLASTTGMSDSTTYGYYISGNTGAVVDTAFRMTFSTGAFAANTDSDFIDDAQQVLIVSDPDTYGYSAGGYDGYAGRLAPAGRLVYSTSVMSARTDVDLSQGRNSGTGLTDGVTYGYYMGGHSGASSSITDRITYSTSVAAAHTDSDLTVAGHGIGGNGDNATYGYVGGGSGTILTNTERMTYSTGVCAKNTDSDLSTGGSNISSYSDGSPN